jgi:hypothetical protein
MALGHPLPSLICRTKFREILFTSLYIALGGGFHRKHGTLIDVFPTLPVGRKVGECGWQGGVLGNICPKRGARHLRPRSINFLVEGCCVGWRVCLFAVPSSNTTSKVHSLESNVSII